MELVTMLLVLMVMTKKMVECSLPAGIRQPLHAPSSLQNPYMNNVFINNVCIVNPMIAVDVGALQVVVEEVVSWRKRRSPVLPCGLPRNDLAVLVKSPTLMVWESTLG